MPSKARLFFWVQRGWLLALALAAFACGCPATAAAN
jgi:hypothetical protein